MEEQVLTVKIDSKGRLCIPAEIREEIGDTAKIKKTSDGNFLLIPSKREDFLEEFKKLITSEPKLKGKRKPRLATPEEMKSVWRTVK
jgi:AbrB family looped-hinge helix DNA binding protein